MPYKNPEERKAYQKAWYEANKDRSATHQKKYKEANKERVLAKKKAWYEANKKRVKSVQKNYFEANKKRVLAKQKAWNEANKERVLAKQRARRHKARSQLDDCYVAHTMGLPKNQCPKELIELKRHQLQLQRLTRQLNQTLQENDDE